MPAGWNTLRNRPPHAPHVVRGSSLIRWNTSTWVPQSMQTYSYVGIGSSIIRGGLRVCVEGSIHLGVGPGRAVLEPRASRAAPTRARLGHHARDAHRLPVMPVRIEAQVVPLQSVDPAL